MYQALYTFYIFNVTENVDAGIGTTTLRFQTTVLGTTVLGTWRNWSTLKRRKMCELENKIQPVLITVNIYRHD